MKMQHKVSVEWQDEAKLMGDIYYLHIRDFFVLRPCVIGFVLRNLCDIYFLQMALVVVSVLLSGIALKINRVAAPK